MDNKSKLLMLEEKDGHHSLRGSRDIGEANTSCVQTGDSRREGMAPNLGPRLYIMKFVLGAVGFLWLVTETGNFFQCRLQLQGNWLFWPLWISLWSILLLGGLVADLLLRKQNPT